MNRLYVISLILRLNNPLQNTVTTKQTLSYRSSSNEDEALGVVMRVTMAAYPDWSVQGYVSQEIIPEHVATVFHEQEGQWSMPAVEEVKPAEPALPVLDEHKEEGDEQSSATSSV
jgi:hypothetical protein